MFTDYAQFETTHQAPYKNYITRCRCGWTCTIYYDEIGNISEQPEILKHRLDHIEGKVKTFSKHSNSAPTSALMKDITEVSHNE